MQDSKIICEQLNIKLNTVYIEKSTFRPKTLLKYIEEYYLFNLPILFSKKTVFTMGEAM